MRALLCAMWRDERGSLLITEWMLVATILVLGIVPAAVSIRHRIHDAIAHAARFSDHDTGSYCDPDGAD